MRVSASLPSHPLHTSTTPHINHSSILPPLQTILTSTSTHFNHNLHQPLQISPPPQPHPLSPSVLWAPSNCFFSSNTESDSVLQSRMLHILQYFTRFPLSSESLFMLKSGFCHNYGFIFFQPIESNFITCFFP